MENKPEKLRDSEDPHLLSEIQKEVKNYFYSNHREPKYLICNRDFSIKLERLIRDHGFGFWRYSSESVHTLFGLEICVRRSDGSSDFEITG